MESTVVDRTQPTVARARWRANAGRWLRRYAPAEVGAAVGALLVGWVANRYGVAAATVYAATVGEFIGFYGVMVVRDLVRRDPDAGRLRSVGRLVLEFGPAELLDALIVRPLAMYLAAVLIGQMMAGILVGKVLADIVFYTVAIICHELSRARRKRARVQP